jgi:hypothetical protein
MHGMSHSVHNTLKSLPLFPSELLYYIPSARRVGSRGFSPFADVETEWPLLLQDISAAVSRSPMVRNTIRTIEYTENIIFV